VKRMEGFGFSKELAVVEIKFHYDREDASVVGKEVLVVPDDPSFSGREYPGIVVGALPSSVEVFCDRENSSLAIGSTETKLHVLVPSLQRLFSESDCCMISFDDSGESVAVDLEVGAPPTDEKFVDWDSQPSAPFVMPSQDFGDHVGGVFKSIRDKGRAIFSPGQGAGFSGNRVDAQSEYAV